MFESNYQEDLNVYAPKTEFNNTFSTFGRTNKEKRANI